MNERELFWEWAKKENPKLIDEAETGCQFAKDILDYMFMGWVGSSNRQGYKLVPVEPSDHMKCVVRDFDPDIEDYANMSSGDWESLCSDIYKAMIGACDDH